MVDPKPVVVETLNTLIAKLEQRAKQKSPGVAEGAKDPLTESCADLIAVLEETVQKIASV